MAQIIAATSPPSNFNTQAVIQYLYQLVNNVQPGNIITASDISNIVNVFNLLVAHTHDIDDLVGKDTFGNSTVYGVNGKYVTISTENNKPVKTAGVIPSNVSPSKKVLATDINTIVNIIKRMVGSHTHDYTEAS